jgi:hypothetical protein
LLFSKREANAAATKFSSKEALEPVGAKLTRP